MDVKALKAELDHLLAIYVESIESGKSVGLTLIFPEIFKLLQYLR